MAVLHQAERQPARIPGSQAPASVTRAAALFAASGAPARRTIPAARRALDPVELPAHLIAAGLAACAAIGALSGFLGIGGGFLLIPLLTFLGRAAGLDDVEAIKHAMGTTLVISSLTALSGYLVHRRAGDTTEPSRLPLAGGVAVGAFVGGSTSARLIGDALYPMFGGALVLSALLFAARREVGRETPLPRGGTAAALGLPIGFAAALVGLGGAVFAGLVLSGILGYPIRRVAAATSLAQTCGAALGAAAFALADFGYVNLPVAAVVLVVTWPAARLGARYTHRVAPRGVRVVYALALLALAAKFVFFR